MKIYGVTGSAGKTTTAYVLATILREEFGRNSVGLLTTEVFWLGEQAMANETHMTSLNARQVYRYLKQMAKAGVAHVVIEMTSHALDQARLAGLKLEGAIITNLSHEHLDYHKTMSAYAAAKGKIMNYLVPDGVLVGNASDEWTSRSLRKAQSRKHKTQSFTAEEAKSVKTALQGDFNQENVLAAMTLARAVGVSEEAIFNGAAEIKRVPGRMEWVETPWGARVLIDFALIPDALERLYKYVRSQTAGKIIGVFGGAGRRDRTKRPKMAAAAASFADEIVLTQDEPYDDPEEQIYADLETGLVAVKIPWQRIEDRREALRYAIGKAEKGDVVVVTGMGNFHYRVVGNKKIPWNDRRVLEKLIREHGV